MGATGQWKRDGACGRTEAPTCGAQLPASGREEAGEGDDADTWGPQVREREREGNRPGAKRGWAEWLAGGPRGILILFLLFKSRNSNKFK